MRVPIFLKILLTIACLWLSFNLGMTNHYLDKRINEQYTALGKLRGDPNLPEAENRKRYTEAKEAIMQRIRPLEAQRRPYWYRLAGILLANVGGWLLWHTIDSIRKRRKGAMTS